jgi:hypothetical protein
MKHNLTPQESIMENQNHDLFIFELDNNFVNIGIQRTDFLDNVYDSILSVNLNKKELHSFIGTLLHVQSKMKGS